MKPCRDPSRSKGHWERAPRNPLLPPGCWTMGVPCLSKVLQMLGRQLWPPSRFLCGIQQSHSPVCGWKDIEAAQTERAVGGLPLQDAPEAGEGMLLRYRWCHPVPARLPASFLLCWLRFLYKLYSYKSPVMPAG